MNFYERFILLCSTRGEKPSPVAQKLGIAKSSVSNWKTRGGYPTDANLKQISNYFGVSVSYLKGEEDEISVNTDTFTPEEKKLFDLIKMLTEDEVKQASDYLGYIISKREK